MTCGKYGAIQRIYFMPAGDDATGKVTRVDFGCIKIRVDDSVEDVVPGWKTERAVQLSYFVLIILLWSKFEIVRAFLKLSSVLQ